MEDTQSVSRKAIWKTAKHFGLPLISCNKGYFIAETDDEITEYKSSIQTELMEWKKREKEPSKTIRNGKMNYTLKNESIAAYNESNKYEFPKYTSQLINWANQNAQGTRPVVVGQMSELFPEFVTSGEEVTIENWHKWYTKKYPNSFDKATDKIFTQVQNLRNAIPLIDRKWSCIGLKTL